MHGRMGACSFSRAMLSRAARLASARLASAAAVRCNACACLARHRHWRPRRCLAIPTNCCATQARPTSDLARIGRLNHVAIAVPELEPSVKMYRDVMGARVSEPQAVPEHGVTVVFVNLPNTKIELLHPLGEQSPIAGFLKRNPAGGIHHVCLEVRGAALPGGLCAVSCPCEWAQVADVRAAIANMKEHGYRVLNEEPKIGAHGTPVTFLHPKDCNGVLVELEEVASA